MRGEACVRIAYVIDTFDVGGTELNAVRTAEALNRRKYQLTVFHLSGNGPLKARYQALANRLPAGDVLLVLPHAQSKERTRLATVVAQFKAKGRHVAITTALR